jgi:hypothetical protein
LAGVNIKTPTGTEVKPAVSAGSKPTTGAGGRPATTSAGSRPTGAGGKPRGANSNRSRPKTKESTKRQSMLNTHRIAPFKYDMNEVLSSSAMDPAKASSFLASIIAKSSRVSTRDAKDFAKTFVDSGDLTKEEYDRIGKLMDKYSKYR